MSYKIELAIRAEKNLLALPKSSQNRIRNAISALSETPRPNGCKKLKGVDAYRIRIGDYRVVYSVKDSILIVSVIDVGHRREIYKILHK